MLTLKTLKLQPDRLIHSLKTAIACLIGFVCTKLIKFHVDQWLIISILVVMCAQISVGSMLQKSYMRFLGTLAGSILSAFAITFLGTSPLTVALTITFAGLVFSYLATGHSSYTDAGALGAVTAAAILIGQNPTLTTAAERFLEISIGILIATLVSQFVLPFHARTYLRQNQAKTFRHLRLYYRKTLLNTTGEDYAGVDENIIKSLIEQRKLAIDAAREPFKKLFKLSTFKESLTGEREIARCINFMQIACETSPETRKIFSEDKVIQYFHEPVCKILESIGTSFEQSFKTRINISLPDAHLLKSMVQDSLYSLAENDKVYAYSFLFCAEILLRRIQELIILISHS